MKTITCYDCEEQFHSDTREDILNQLHAHYMKDHHAIITGVDEAGKKAWMERFEKDWAVA